IQTAEAQLFVPQTFIQPEDDFQILKDSGLFDSFQKKGLINPTQISINKGNLGVNQSQITGFVFEKIEETGGVKDIFKLDNVPESNRSVITISTKKYTRWSAFKEEQLSTMLEAASFLGPYVSAIGFTYVDVFKWEESGPIPVKEIFNTESELITQKFLNSVNGTLTLISQGGSKNLKTEEKTEMVFNNDIKRVHVLHQFVIKLNGFKKINNNNTSDLISLFDNAHSEHKNFIDSVLSSKCKKSIHFVK
ncbi:TIGR04255 family protein, partial [Bacteroidota bacterium]